MLIAFCALQAALALAGHGWGPPKAPSRHSQQQNYTLEWSPANRVQLQGNAPNAGRSLLQGDAPNATLPNWFNLPVCSKHGSHNTSVLRSLPRSRPGIVRFGPQQLEPNEFHPLSSVYMEPVIVLALPGFLGFLILLCSACCFCHRRYRLGLCGEPIPTVRAYPPREVACNMGTALLSFSMLLTTSGLAVIVANASYEVAFAGVIDAGYRAEAILNQSFTLGSALLGNARATTASLDGFDAFVAGAFARAVG